MKIVIEYNSLVSAASTCKCYDDFTYDGWNWLEQWHEGFMGEDETLEPFDLKHEYYEQPLSDLADFGEDIDEDSLCHWLLEHDYILGWYDVRKWNDENRPYSETYVMSYRDVSEPCEDDMPADFFRMSIHIEKYLGFSVGKLDKEKVATALYEYDEDNIVIDYDGENVIVDKRQDYEKRPFSNIEEMKKELEM